MFKTNGSQLQNGAQDKWIIAVKQCSKQMDHNGPFHHSQISTLQDLCSLPRRKEKAMTRTLLQIILLHQFMYRQRITPQASRSIYIRQCNIIRRIFNTQIRKEIHCLF
uniref:Uncharacterized protein n=1 Tax=Opuntia streptacantha TaxID=393608 RepID=A0A7C9CSZ3_OPUST